MPSGAQAQLPAGPPPGLTSENPGAAGWRRPGVRSTASFLGSKRPRPRGRTFPSDQEQVSPTRVGLSRDTVTHCAAHPYKVPGSGASAHAQLCASITTGHFRTSSLPWREAPLLQARGLAPGSAPGGHGSTHTSIFWTFRGSRLCTMWPLVSGFPHTAPCFRGSSVLCAFPRSHRVGTCRSAGGRVCVFCPCSRGQGGPQDHLCAGVSRDTCLVLSGLVSVDLCPFCRLSVQLATAHPQSLLTPQSQREFLGLRHLNPLSCSHEVTFCGGRP